MVGQSSKFYELSLNSIGAIEQFDLNQILRCTVSQCIQISTGFCCSYFDVLVKALLARVLKSVKFQHDRLHNAKKKGVVVIKATRYIC